MTRFRRDLDVSGCCNNWKNGIRTIDGQYPDDNRDFNLAAGDGIEITPVTAGVEISVKAPLPGPMIFRGTVGTGGTVASLPDANVDNIGWTYVAVTAGSTPDDTPKSYEIGDMLVSNGEEWTVIPAGDDPVEWSQIQNTPTSLSGYGITDAVDIGSEQTITGNKTFDGSLTKHTAGFSEIVVKSDRVSGNIGGVQTYDGDGHARTGFLGNAQANNESRALIYAFDASNSNARNQLALGFIPNNSGNARFYATLAGQRDYNSANTGDIVTIGSLAANPNVVHTTGNETIAGRKLFSNILSVITDSHQIASSDTATANQTVLKVISPDGNTECRIYITADDNNTVKIEIGKWHNGSYVNSNVISSL